MAGMMSGDKSGLFARAREMSMASVASSSGKYAKIEESSVEPSTVVPPPPARKEPWLTGLRGVLVLQSLVWIYFDTFIPSLVHRDETGAKYESVVRDVLSSVLWNPTLIASGFIILSMRTIPITFLRAPSPNTYAGSVIRRIFRFALMLSAATALGVIASVLLGTTSVDEFKLQLPNTAMMTPVQPRHTSAVFNSIFNLFFVNKHFKWQAANTFWPSASLWVPSLVFYQSWTVYFLMVIMPYSRPAWHFQGLLAFALGSFWYGSWGWYSATGLLLADVASNQVLQNWLHNGIPLGKGYRFPCWILALMGCSLGVALKYIFTIFPQESNKILYLNAFLDLSDYTIREEIAAQGAYARVDDWLVVTGVLVMVELFDFVKDALTYAPLIWLGERSFSFFTAQSIIIYAVGIKTWLSLHNGLGLNEAASNGIVLLVCMPLVALAAEVFYRLVDVPSRWLAKGGFSWLLS